MMAHRGYFVIADITGYTAFFTGSELDHAQDILKSLFNALLDSIQPPLLISNFQGDAILMYAPEGSFVQGQTLLEGVESIYCAFAHTLELMHHNTTCTCRACANIPTLDLKLFVHYGEYLLQDMRGKAELSGPDVIIAHRMMKNEVKEATGFRAYTLFTEAAVNALGIQEFTCEMKPHSETYEHIGEVKMFAYCMRTMWEREREKRRMMVSPDEIWIKVESDIPATAAVVWDFLNDPARRREMLDVKDVTLSDTTNGRRGVGAIHHCAHGGQTTDFLIVDWKPFEYFTEEYSGIPLKMSGYCTTQLTPIAEGTHVAIVFGKARSSSAVLGMVAKLMEPMFKRKVRSDYEKMFDRLQTMLERDHIATESEAVTA